MVILLFGRLLSSTKLLSECLFLVSPPSTFLSSLSCHSSSLGNEWPFWPSGLLVPSALPSCEGQPRTQETVHPANRPPAILPQSHPPPASQAFLLLQSLRKLSSSLRQSKRKPQVPSVQSHGVPVGRLYTAQRHWPGGQGLKYSPCCFH